MGVKERIIEFIELKEMPIKQFEEKCTLSNGYISSMRKGFGTEKLDNVLREFPELNREWLLHGEGEMLKNTSQIEITNRTKDSDIISMPSDVWAVIRSQAESLKAKDRQMDVVLESLKFKDEQTAEVIELLKEQLKKGRDAPTRLRAANLVVEEDE